jgi:hypothetical protein
MSRNGLQELNVGWVAVNARRPRSIDGASGLNPQSAQSGNTLPRVSGASLTIAMPSTNTTAVRLIGMASDPVAWIP